MKSKTLYITHPEVVLENTTSVLLTTVDQDLHNDQYHTSLGDMSAQDILSILKHFTKIEFIKNKFIDDSLHKETMVMLNYASHFILVNGVDFEPEDTFTEINEVRGDQPVLWVFGCSHSYGVGLRSNELKYSEIIASQLQLPLKLVAKPGSSLHWSLRHLIAADVRAGDTVIWQLTTPGRLSMVNGNNIEEIQLARTKNIHLLEVYSDDQVYFDQLALLRFGVQYLRAKNINFVITSIEDHTNTRYRKEYTKYPEYCYAPGFNIDLGTDNLHCGPLSNKNLAIAILNHIQYKNA